MRLSLGLALLAFAISVCCSGAAFASPIQHSASAGSSANSPSRGRDAHHLAAHLARKLQLTPEQTTSVESILQKRMQQLAQLRADSSIAPRDRRSQLRTIRQDSEQQLSAVLNASQLQQYRQMQQQAKQRHLEHMQSRTNSNSGKTDTDNADAGNTASGSQ